MKTTEQRMKTTEQKVEALVKIVTLFRPFISMILSPAQVKQFDQLLKELNS